jgi:hypothetical protein
MNREVVARAAEVLNETGDLSEAIRAAVLAANALVELAGRDSSDPLYNRDVVNALYCCRPLVERVAGTGVQ